MKLCRHQLAFHAGECPVFPPPGMATLGRPISGPDVVLEVESEKRPVLEVEFPLSAGSAPGEARAASAGGSACMCKAEA
jgi:hypothetical protein